MACLCDPTFDSDTDDFERIWAPGLGFFPQVLFAPHWDMVDTWIPGAQAFIQAAAPADGHLIALDERTAMVGDGETWQVSGVGGVGVYRAGAWVGEHRAGASFSLAAVAGLGTRPPGSIGDMPAAREPTLSRTDPIGQRAPEVIRILRDAYPGATVALNFSNPLEILIATILSAQCTDVKVNEVTATLFVKYRTPEDYVRVPEDELRADIKPTGFYNQKAASIRATCARLIEAYDGQVPDTMEELLTLRGVARKTANIVLANGFGKVEGIPVDTHVKRLSNRIGFSSQSDPDKIEQDLMRLVPREEWSPFSYVLIDHGRRICQAKKPRCVECPIEPLCPSSQA